MYDVMVDLETTGTDPAHNGILQLAAVKFDYASGEISSDIFNAALILAPARHWDFGTIQWWREKKDRVEHLNLLMRTGQPAKDVLTSFNTWLGNPEKPLRLWAKPVSFELPFLTSYYSQFGLPMPFHYRYAMDVNTFVRGLRKTPEHDRDDVEVPFEGMPHNAVFDALHEVRIVMKAKEVYANQ